MSAFDTAAAGLRDVTAAHFGGQTLAYADPTPPGGPATTAVNLTAIHVGPDKDMDLQPAPEQRGQVRRRERLVVVRASDQVPKLNGRFTLPDGLEWVVTAAREMPGGQVYCTVARTEQVRVTSPGYIK